MTKYLESLNMKATTLASRYCELFNGGEATSKELKDAKKAANNAMDDYNLELSIEVYKEWSENGKPVETAVRSYYVPGALKLKFVEKDNIMAFSVVNANYPVDLLRMDTVLGRKVFASPDWHEAVEKFMYLIANYVVERTSGTLQYQIDKASAYFQFPADVDPLSDEGALIAFQTCMDKILFIPDPTDETKNLIRPRWETDHRGRTYAAEWEIIRESITAKSKKELRSINLCNTLSFTNLILEAMNGILTYQRGGCTTDEHIGRESYEKSQKDLDLKNDTTEAPTAQPIPETHTPAKEKTAKTTEKKTTDKKGGKKDSAKTGKSKTK